MKNFTISLNFDTFFDRADLMSIVNSKITASHTRIALLGLWCFQDSNDYLEEIIQGIIKVVDTEITQEIIKKRSLAVVLILSIVWACRFFKTGHLLINIKRW